MADEAAPSDVTPAGEGNQGDQAASIAPVFRVNGKAPELWDPVSGHMVKAAAFAPTAGGMRGAASDGIFRPP